MFSRGGHVQISQYLTWSHAAVQVTLIAINDGIILTITIMNSATIDTLTTLKRPQLIFNFLHITKTKIQTDTTQLDTARGATKVLMVANFIGLRVGHVARLADGDDSVAVPDSLCVLGG